MSFGWLLWLNTQRNRSKVCNYFLHRTRRYSHLSQTLQFWRSSSVALWVMRQWLVHEPQNHCVWLRGNDKSYSLLESEWQSIMSPHATALFPVTTRPTTADKDDVWLAQRMLFSYLFCCFNICTLSQWLSVPDWPLMSSAYFVRVCQLYKYGAKGTTGVSAWRKGLVLPSERRHWQ